MSHERSMDQPFGDSDDGLHDSLYELPDEDASGGEDLRAAVGALLGVLEAHDPRLASILRQRFEFDEVPNPTLKGVGQSEGVSKERIRQLEARGIAFLQEHLRHSPRLQNALLILMNRDTDGSDEGAEDEY
jgi:RNA polymerase primary sigma factor